MRLMQPVLPARPRLARGAIQNVGRFTTSPRAELMGRLAPAAMLGRLAQRLPAGSHALDGLSQSLFAELASLPARRGPEPKEKDDDGRQRYRTVFISDVHLGVVPAWINLNTTRKHAVTRPWV